MLNTLFKLRKPQKTILSTASAENVGVASHHDGLP
jgi:hypothetical protein